MLDIFDRMKEIECEGDDVLDGIEKRDRLIRSWMEEAAQKIQQHASADPVVEEKTGRKDLVTNMDREIEQFFVEKIKKEYPAERIYGEEGFGDEVNDLSGIVWFVDPIDGTLNYVLQKENFAIMLGVYEDGEGRMGYIYDMNTQSLYSAIKGKGIFKDNEPFAVPTDQKLSDGLLASSSLLMTDDRFEQHRDVAKKTLGVRMIGSAGLEILEVLKGNVVGYMAASLEPWDIAPGKVMMDEAGICCTQFNGEDVNLLRKNRVLFAYPTAYREMMDSFSEN